MFGEIAKNRRRHDFARPKGRAKIKRTDVRWLPAVAKAYLHIGFCTLRSHLDDTSQGATTGRERISSFDFNLQSDGARNVR